MKKLLLLGVVGFASLTSSAEMVYEYTPLDRSGWTITGCSQQNNSSGTDKGYAALIDGDLSTMYHSNYSSHATDCPHYLVIDRGENASESFNAFGYMPRTDVQTGNGYVLGYKLYLLDSIDGLETAGDSNTPAGTSSSISDNHASLATLIADKEPVYTMPNSETVPQQELIARFDESTKRYVLMVITATKGSNLGDNNAVHGMEMNLYHAIGHDDAHTYTFNYTLDNEVIRTFTTTQRENTEYTVTLPEFCTTTVNTFTLGSTTTIEVPVTFSKFKFDHVYRMKLRDKYVSFNGINIVNGNNTALAPEHLWYAKLAGYDEASNTLKITLHTVADNSKGIFVPGTTTSSDNSLSTTPQAFCLRQNTSDNNSGFTLTHPDNANACVNDNSNRFGVWNVANGYNDGGNRLNFLSLTEEDLATLNIQENATPNEFLAAFYALNISQYIINADAFAATGIPTAEGIAAWNNFKGSIGSATDDPTELQSNTIAAYQALVATSANTPGGAHVKFASNKEPNDFMCVRLMNNNYKSGRYGSDVNGNKTTWTLEATTGGFRLYNEYSGKYAKFPTANNTGFALVSDAEQSSVFTIDLFDASTARYGVKCVSQDADATLCYLHTNMANDIFRWEKGANSSWYIQASNAETAANEANIGANEDVENARTNFVYAGTVGSKVGEYSDANSHDAEYNAALSAFNALNNESTNAAKHSAAGSLRAIYPTMNLSLNMPQAGKFYRLAGDSKYLTSTPSGTDRIAMVDKSNNGATTVVYVNEDGKLISLNNGLALGKFTTDGNRLFVGPDVDDAATVEFSSCPAIGKYYIKTGSNDTQDFYIYNASDVVDSGSYDKGSTTGIDDNTGYRWNIEEVTWLPIPVGENKHVTIYSPVALRNDNNRFKLHTLEVNGEFAEIIKTPLEDGAYIQPNTAYYGEVSTTEEPTNGCYYLEIAETEQAAALAADEAEAETLATQIKGSFLATTKQEGTNYYTIGVKDEAAHFLAHTDDTYLPGFTAHVVSTAPSEAVNTLGGYKLVTKDGASTSIREVEAAAQGADTVYDLSGRRVSKAVRGLYIINGKKVMVK